MLIPTDFLIAGAFYTFAALAVVGAVGLILAPRVFHSALFLTLALGSVAAVFVTLGADFLAAVQVLIYVGAIMVLIIFGIMLTPQEIELPNMGTSGQALAGTLVAGAIFVMSAVVAITTRWPNSVPTPTDRPTTDVIAVGLFNTYALPFEIASVLLVIAMIGAIVIAREE